MVPESSKIAVGEVINDIYEVTGVYGAGGFAVVYRAEQLNLGRRKVAIKVLNPVPEGERGEVITQRFLQEAQAAASIQHSNVVMIHDVGFLSGNRPFIVMQPFVGHDLRREISRNGAMNPRRFLPIFTECLGALAQAHRQGIIHRDLKPGNFILTDIGTREESMKLIDFGIARLMSGDLQLTRTSHVVGTTRYMAPEYITSNHVSPALDVYQCGLVMVEVICGRPVIDAKNSVQCLHMAVNGAWAIPDELKASPLGEVLRRSICLNPAERYADAGELREALEAVDPGTVPQFTTDGEGRLVAAAPLTPVAPARPPEVSAGAWSHSAETDKSNLNVAMDKRAPATTHLPGEDIKTEWGRTRDTARRPQRGALMAMAVGATMALLVSALVGAAWLGVRALDEGAQAPSAEPAEGPRSDARAPLKAKVIVEQESPTPVEVTIHVKPETATVLASNGVVLGRGQAVVRFEGEGAEDATVKVEQAGYSSERVQISPRGPSSVSVVLERRRTRKIKPRDRPSRQAPPTSETKPETAPEPPPVESRPPTPAEEPPPPDKGGSFGIME